jgi:hypothetical protein
MVKKKIKKDPRLEEFLNQKEDKSDNQKKVDKFEYLKAQIVNQISSTKSVKKKPIKLVNK